MSPPVVTRFPPSPTGLLHIGGVRTALFNWLFARHHGGKFLLRIEDTDRERSTEDAKRAIVEGLEWLGLDHDGDIVLQSTRSARHRDCAQRLLAEGKAYRCYATPEDLEAMRAEARATGKPPVYSGLWRDRPASDAPDNAPFTIRLKSPLSGELTISDQVQGDVTVNADALDDLVLLRSDGTATYMLAVVVDDYDMGVTHVIRGDDHLSNAFRQHIIFEALGWSPPIYAHIPLIHGEDGAKLSKRHGALGVESYRDMGLLPEAILGTLLRLGWSHGDQEVFTMAQAQELFSLEAVGRSPSQLDFEKFRHINAIWMKTVDSKILLKQLKPFIEKHIPNPNMTRVESGLGLLLPRAQTLIELADEALCLATPAPLNYEAEGIYDLLSKAPEGALQALHDRLADMDWETEDVAAMITDTAKALASEFKVKMGAIGMPLRAAVTARTSTPSIFEICACLGRNETLARLQAGTDYLNLS